MIDKNVLSIYKMLASSLSQQVVTSEDVEHAKLCWLVHFRCHQELNRLIKESKDRKGYHELIESLVTEIMGSAWTLTGHGITKRLNAQFDDAQKTRIVSLIEEFSDFLDDEIGVKSFITSGTLLGCIRDSDFIGHDDDIDLAYVSNYESKDEIIAERILIFNCINSHQSFRAEERDGQRLVVKVKDGELEFWFDLFSAFCRDGFFNECPLKPNTLRASDIVPLKKVDFLGGKVPVPNNPEKLLELNYGSGWATPDPAFRFDFGEHQHFYWFLKSNPIREA